MANIKLKNNYWVTESIYDTTDSKTQKQVNADLHQDISDLNGAITSLGSDDIANDSTNVSGLKVTNALDTLNGAITQTDSNIAYIVDGNKSTTAISSGKYVLVRNSTISGISDGLYTASQAIPANTVLTSSYFTATSGGGLNQITPISLGGTAASSVNNALDNLDISGSRSYIIEIPANSTATYNIGTTNTAGMIFFIGTASSRLGIYAFGKTSGATTPQITTIAGASGATFTTGESVLSIKNTTNGVLQGIVFHNTWGKLPTPTITANT